jgi:hypothetical protein
LKKLLLAIGTLILLTGCTSEQMRIVEFWNRPTSSPVPCQQWVGATRAAGIPENLIPTIQYIMHRESNCQNGVVSSTDDWGLMQINRPSWQGQLERAGIISGPEDLFNPGTNLKAAKYVLDHQGLSAWRK